MNYFEYIWLDGGETPQLRSKTKIYPEENTPKLPPVWGFDGSSTGQAEGNKSDCVLKPVRLYDDPFRTNSSLVLCEVMNADNTEHETNTRAKLKETFELYKDEEPWFGIEQEYTLLNKEGVAIGFEKQDDIKPQGDYYCGVGTANIYGRGLVEEHAECCAIARIAICGLNAEVMPGQWEYQIGAEDPLRIADDLWVSRWILHRVAEEHDMIVSLDPKPAEGDWNGAGAHTNYSTLNMRDPEIGLKSIESAIDKLSKKHKEHIEVYGRGNFRRLTGIHETCDINTFKSGVSDRGASIRVPGQVSFKGYGYLEDRRPSANCDPYLVLNAILETTLGENNEQN